MQERLGRWFPLKMYTDPIAQYRARGTYASAVVIAVGTVISLVITATMLIGGADLHNFTLMSILVGDVVLIIAVPLIALLTRFKRQMLAALVMLAVWYSVAFYAYFGIKDREAGIIISLIVMALDALLIGEVTVRYNAGLSV